MRFKYLTLIAVLCALILLRQGISGVRELSPQFDRFAGEVERRKLEPALLFYTESSHVREAEQELRQALNSIEILASAKMTTHRGNQLNLRPTPTR